MGSLSSLQTEALEAVVTTAGSESGDVWPRLGRAAEALTFAQFLAVVDQLLVVLTTDIAQAYPSEDGTPYFSGFRYQVVAASAQHGMSQIKRDVFSPHEIAPAQIMELQEVMAAVLTILLSYELIEIERFLETGLFTLALQSASTYEQVVVAAY